jgi:hypothetical protein
LDRKDAELREEVKIKISDGSKLEKKATELEKEKV